jgi:2-haloacid dehalogenase
MSDTRPVEAVVFDVGRVIVQWDLRALFGKLIADPDRLDRFCGTVVTEDWHYQCDAGRDLDEMVAERKRMFPAEADLLDAYATRFLETIPGPIAGTSELIERLAARGVPLYAITNFGSLFWSQFRPTMPVLGHFREVVVSGDEKIAKPDTRIFDLAAQRFGHAPQAMLFIDDNQANIAAAAALGWQVHHFVEAGALERDLANRGLI